MHNRSVGMQLYTQYRKIYILSEHITNMDMSVTCGNCKRKTQDYSFYCFICKDYYCSDHCHQENHCDVNLTKEVKNLSNSK